MGTGHINVLPSIQPIGCSLIVIASEWPNMGPDRINTLVCAVRQPEQDEPADSFMR